MPENTEPINGFYDSNADVDKKYLDFEKPIADLGNQINELKALQIAKKVDYNTEIREMRSNQVRLTQKIFDNLTPWETVQIARHPQRPLLPDYMDLMVKDFQQLHGDRFFADDKAIISGFGRIGRERVMLIGQNKGRDTKEKIACNFGCTHPEGYRKALKKMKLAEKYGLPVVCLIDTQGAYPGIGAEERGQAEAIAVNMMEMSRLKTPIVCVVIGEGGSGGALGIGVGDSYAMMEYAWYSVISPEGCAAILWKSGDKAAEAAVALKLTSTDMKGLGIVDDVIPEPLGGAHRNHHEAAYNLENYIVRKIRELKGLSTEKLLDLRYKKLMSMGKYSISDN
ncbi:MAG: acetyl-CoA carboxylase carboxyltransferase subunit alpha [Phycisphaerae bacterium]|nr:acetyl-CoA carboxylase carboxyltransferase subunit alpha [Phycisphaerae bacterium]